MLGNSATDRRRLHNSDLLVRQVVQFVDQLVNLTVEEIVSAVLREEYVQPLQNRQVPVFVLYGHIPALPVYGTTQSGVRLARDMYFERLETICRRVEAVPLNLSELSPKNGSMRRLQFENDSHPSPFWHYEFAALLKRKLLKHPQFQKVLQRRPSGDGPSDTQ